MSTRQKPRKNGEETGDSWMKEGTGASSAFVVVKSFDGRGRSRGEESEKRVELTMNFSPSRRLSSLSRAIPPRFGSPLKIFFTRCTFPPSVKKPRKNSFSFPPSQAFPMAELAREGDGDDARREMRCWVGLLLLEEEEEGVRRGVVTVAVSSMTLIPRRRFP